MEKFPNIQPGRFVVMFLDRNTGHVFDIDLKLFQDTVDSTQKVYAIFNSLADAKEYADQKITGDTRSHLDFGYMIYDHNNKIVIDNDSGRHGTFN